MSSEVETSVVLPKTPGIYCIWNDSNDDCYIGSAVNLYSRISCHKSTLRNNKHFNLHLQRAWNKYGESSFDFFVLKFCDKTKCIEEEQWCIDILKPKYNIRTLANSNLGIACRNETKTKIANTLRSKNIKQSKEVIANRVNKSKDKISKSLLNNKEHMRNCLDRILKQSTLNRKPIEVEKTIDKTVITYSFNSIKEASEKLNIPKSNIQVRLTGNVKSPYKGIYKFKYKK